MHNELFRILDVNINRVSEGLRVLEDHMRFGNNAEHSTVKIRELRHAIRSILKKYDSNLLVSRNTFADFGKDFAHDRVNNDCKSVSVAQLCTANCKRIQEAIRSIEESLKIIGDYEASQKMQNLRFMSYALEQLFARKQLPNGLYCITASNFSNGRSNTEVVKAMLDAGCAIIQYREKYKSIREKYDEAAAIKKIIEKYDALFIINDHPEIALAIDADGVHIGQDDMPIGEIRKLVGQKIIGLSTHSPQQALEAQKEGADYIGVGPIFATKTKDNVCAPVGLEYAAFAQKELTVPFYAIGGIKENNLHQITELGISRVVMVTEITTAENITETCKRIQHRLVAGEKTYETV